MRKILLVVFFAGLYSLPIFAQSNNSSQANAGDAVNTIDWDNFELEMDKVEGNWTFHTDNNSRVLYIDFEALGGNMSKLVLKNAAQEVVVMDDQLFDLPINTIYEVSLSKLGKGNYSLELHTYNSVIREEINIQ